ncbi:MAG: polysaccharide pyruvyl transferase CsaB [Capsulimonadaceae bacterium]|nr:polysaccharide pyruvyl transferase CsaB [Capsulimonadaceae bacterium]
MKRVLLSGYYGFDNAGDEAVLAGLVKSVRDIAPPDSLSIEALSINPMATARDHAILAVHRMRLGPVLRSIARTDLLASGGGSLLQDVTSRHGIFYYLAIVRLAQIMGKRTMFVAQGIGPLNEPRSRKLTASVANRLDAITVRDNGSAQLLRDIGVTQPVEVTADPALLLTPKAQPDRDQLRDGVATSLRPWRNCTGRVVDTLAQSWKDVLQPEPLVVMAMQPDVDGDAGARLAAALGAPSPAPSTGLWTHVETVRQVKMVIGMRLHALILAAAARTPMLALSYDPKIDAFMTEIGQSDAVFNVEHDDPAELTPLLARIWSERASRAHALEAVLPALEARASRNAKIMVDLASGR